MLEWVLHIFSCLKNSMAEVFLLCFLRVYHYFSIYQYVGVQSIERFLDICRYLIDYKFATTKENFKKL